MLRRFSLCVCLLLFSLSSGAAAQIKVELPVGVAAAGEELALPVTVSDLTGRSVQAYEFTISYDTTVLNLHGAEIAGTLSEEGMQIANARTPGMLRFAFASSRMIKGEGILLIIRGTALEIGKTGLHFDSFTFNEGDPEATATDGELTVGIPE